MFLGHHELARQTAPIRFPFFFQMVKRGVYASSLGEAAERMARAP
jgi:hypothetical protein